MKFRLSWSTRTPQAQLVCFALEEDQIKQSTNRFLTTSLSLFWRTLCAALNISGEETQNLEMVMLSFSGIEG